MTKLVAGYTPQARCTYLFMYVGVLWQYHQSVVAIKYNGFLLVACNDVPQKYRVTATKPRALVRQVSARTPWLWTRTHIHILTYILIPYIRLVRINYCYYSLVDFLFVALLFGAVCLYVCRRRALRATVLLQII